MIRIAICDDDNFFLNQTTNHVKQWALENKYDVKVYTFNNGDDLLKELSHTKMDICLLDIIMPLLSGIEAAKEIRQKDKSVKIIFLTSNTEYALDAYSVKAQSYIVKPADYHKVVDALNDCVVLLEEEPISIVIKTPYGYQKIYVHTIEYLEAFNKKTIFHLNSNKQVETNDPLYAFESQLTINDGFFKSHRSFVVNMSNIDHFNNNAITTKTQKSIPIARGSYKPLQEAYFTYMFKEE